MSRVKGSPKTGGGSRLGRPNKVTRDIKQMVIGALCAEGGERWLRKQMNDNPVAFMGLIARVLPLQLTSDPNAPLTVKISIEEHRRRAVEEIRAAFPERQIAEPSPVRLSENVVLLPPQKKAGG